MISVMRQVYLRLTTVLAVLLSLFATHLSASPAGVIPYSCIVGDAYVLLAFDPVSDRVGHGAFGGGREGDETIAETAAREMREETRCAFDRPTATDLESATPSNSNGFYSFVYQVPYVPQGDIADSACRCRHRAYRLAVGTDNRPAAGATGR